MSFDDVVRSALDTLPPHLAEALRNVAVVVEDENPEDPDLYGLFDGIPLTEGGPGPGDLPNRPEIEHGRGGEVGHVRAVAQLPARVGAPG